MPRGNPHARALAAELDGGADAVRATRNAISAAAGVRRLHEEESRSQIALRGREAAALKEASHESEGGTSGHRLPLVIDVLLTARVSLRSCEKKHFAHGRQP